MMKRLTWKITLCLGLLILAGVVVAAAYRRYVTTGGGFRLGVDLVGGTILVYEVDQDKFSDARARQEFEQHAHDLAAAIKKRIDPADLYNVTVRQVGTWRVEIILPTGGAHEADLEARAWQDLLRQVRRQYQIPEAATLEEVPQGDTAQLVARVHDALEAAGREESPEKITQFVEDHFQQHRLSSEEVEKVKEKIAQVGSLEFRILANSRDDRRAIRFAEDYFEQARKNPASRQRHALTVDAITGKPPPPPRDESGNLFLDAPTLHQRFTYSWLELGRSERHTLGLDNASAGPTPYVELEGAPVDPRRHFWHEAAVSRGEEKVAQEVQGGKRVRKYVRAAGEAWDKLLEEVKRQYRLPEGALLDVPPGDVDALANRVHDLLRGRQREEPVVAIRQFIRDHYQVEASGAMPLPQLGGALLYSRLVPNPSRLPPADRNKRVEYFLLTRDPQRGKEVTGLYLERAYPTQDSSLRPAVGFRFNRVGGDRFYELTSQNAPTPDGFHRFLAVVLDGQIESAPSLNARIGREGIIEGNFAADEVNRLANMLNSGALPASLKQTPVSENTIGPTLGADTIVWGTWSVLIAFVAVLAFMLVYYRFAGLVACIALFANLLLTVAFMVVVHATFTLPGLAGLVLMLGMAVDANVLIYERLREERDRGAGLALAIRNGYGRAFPTIIDTHLSSIFTAVVLYAVGNDQLKGFGISLTVGLLISLFTSLFMTRLLFDVWLAKGWLRKLSMMRLLARPHIDFMALRSYFFAGTVLTSVLGASLFLYRGTSGLNIDFVGGTAYGGVLNEPKSIGELRRALGEKAQEDKLRVAEVRPLDETGRLYEILYAGSDRFRRIELPNPATPEEVRARARQLPDLSVDQVFVSSNDPKVRQGDRSAFFTVRTTEKAPDLVLASITRLLGDDLKRVGLAEASKDNPFLINPSNTEATLRFVDLGTGEPAYPSPAQVRVLLERELNALGVAGQAQQFLLTGEGKQVDGRFQTMKLTLLEPLDRATLEKALKHVAQEFQHRPQPERLENFDGQLARETQTRTLYAILASWAAILLYLWFRFGSWTFGLAAVLCLIHDLFFTLGAIATCHYLHDTWAGYALGLKDFKIDLPAVAALLTLVGYSVNDTIVVFDRIREVRGKNPGLTSTTINDSVNQTLSRTLLTALTVFLVVSVLYIFGGEGVHLFAFVMVVGVLVGTHSSIYIASPLLLIFGEGRHGAPVRQPPVAAGAV